MKLPLFASNSVAGYLNKIGFTRVSNLLCTFANNAGMVKESSMDLGKAEMSLSDIPKMISSITPTPTNPSQVMSMNRQQRRAAARNVRRKKR